MNLEEEIRKLIESSAREGAFTAATIKQFDLMAEKVKTLETTKDKLQKECEARNERAEKLEKELHSYLARVETLTKQVEAYKKQEFTFELNNRMMAFEKERREEMRSIVSDIFRNVEVHRSIAKTVFTPVEGIPPNQYNVMGMSGSVHQNPTTENVTEVQK